MKLISEEISTKNDKQKDLNLAEIGELELRILTPTLCVMDRLAGFYHWNDRQNLDQAVMVAKLHQIDFEKVKLWSKKEGKITKYQEFVDWLNFR